MTEEKKGGNREKENNDGNSDHTSPCQSTARTGTIYKLTLMSISRTFGTSNKKSNLSI